MRTFSFALSLATLFFVQSSPGRALDLEAPIAEPIFVRVQTYDLPAPACLMVDELIAFELAMRSHDAVRIGDSLLNSDCLLLSASSHGQATKASAYGYAWVDFDYAQPVDAVTLQPVQGAVGPSSYWVPASSLVDMFTSDHIQQRLKSALGH